MSPQPSHDEEQVAGQGEKWLRELLARRGAGTGGGAVHAAMLRSAVAAGLIEEPKAEDAGPPDAA